MPNRSQKAVQERIAEIEAGLPFPILGFDTDNGGEFLNWHLLAYFQKRPRPVHFTRSRAYRKNDNARVEQKNPESIRGWSATGGWKVRARPSYSMICMRGSGAGFAISFVR